jgi:mRNA-degrading endonuclease RelE of RelBE toxin-antitoxin system
LKVSAAIEREIIKEIRNLPAQQQKKILDVVRLLKIGIEATQKKRDITELRGCGKNIWTGVGAQEYVNKLREEWS